jgi:glycosyltransferase involved in cell wall biosynthesis
MNLLSIITINLNNRNGLQKTIESISEQTFTDFEYIIIDGASTDGSKEIIDQYRKKTFGNFKWISESDSGVYEAMNKGIKLATCEYLLFLNSGDFLINGNVLSDVFSNLHTSDFLLGCCNISENGIIIHKTNPPDKITFGYIYVSGLAHQSTFIKREMFTKYGYYREDFRYNSDIEFWYRTIILNCCSTETLPIIISDYNNNGISSKESKSDAYQKELAEIYSLPLLQRFIPDYDAWKREQQEMQDIYWVKSKKTLYGILHGMYKLACWYVKLRK